MSKIPNRNENRTPHKAIGDQHKFLSRITKTLYYGKLPKTERLSLPASELASEIFSESHKGYSLNRLYVNQVAEISRNTCVSSCSLVLALLYFDRLKILKPEYLRQIVPSELFLISLMVSSKFLHDDGEEDEVFADEWARSGDITISELCKLEREFLAAIDWNVFVRGSTFWEKLEQIETDIAMREGTKRGWFTYTELNLLISTHDVTNLLQSLVAVSVVLAAAYVAGFLTIAGSVFLASRVPGTSLHSYQHNDASALNRNDMRMENLIATEIGLTVKPKTYKILDVFKTGIILASVNYDFDNVTTTTAVGCDSSRPSWDWWNNPIMNWLTDISRSNGENEAIKLPDNYYKNFAHDTLVDMSIARQKTVNLQVKIHEATKLRLQEQMERSWHAEWTDIVFAVLNPYKNEIRA